MKVKIFSVAHWPYFKELAEALSLSFQELGHDAKAEDWNNRTDFGDLNVVITAHRLFDHRKQLPKGTIKVLLQVEQLWNRREKEVYDKSTGYDRVLELYKANCEIPRGTEKVIYFPLGYSRIFAECMYEKAPVYKGYFFGSMNKRRKRIHQLLQSNFDKICFEQESHGALRDNKIHNATINLHVSSHDGWEHSPLRSLMIQCKGKFLLAEKSMEYLPYHPGKHYVEFNSQENLIEKFDYWLNHNKEREEFAFTAKEDLRRNHTMTDNLQKVLCDLL